MNTRKITLFIYMLTFCLCLLVIGCKTEANDSESENPYTAENTRVEREYDLSLVIRYEITISPWILESEDVLNGFPTVPSGDFLITIETEDGLEKMNEFLSPLIVTQLPSSDSLTLTDPVVVMRIYFNDDTRLQFAFMHSRENDRIWHLPNDFIISTIEEKSFLDFVHLALEYGNRLDNY